MLGTSSSVAPSGTLPYVCIVPHYGTTFSNRIKIEEEGQAEMYVWRIQRLAQDYTEAKYEGSHSWLKSPLVLLQLRTRTCPLSTVPKIRDRVTRNVLTCKTKIWRAEAIGRHQDGDRP